MSSQRSSTQGVYVTLPELIALRAQAKRKPWLAVTSSRTTIPGEQRSPERGRGIEFGEVRPYLQGDDIRRIDWRTSARKGTPYTKLFTEERERSVYLAIDQRVSLFFGSGKYFKSVAAARAAALIGWSFVLCGHHLSGVVVGQSIMKTKAHASQRALLQLLNATTLANRQLSAHTTDTHTQFQLLDECIANAKRGTTVTVVSDFSDWNDSASHSLQLLSKKCTVRLVRIIDALEDTLPRRALVSISDGQTQRTVALNSSTQEKHLAYRQQLTEKLRSDCQRLNVSLTVLHTNDELNSLWSYDLNG